MSQQFASPDFTASENPMRAEEDPQIAQVQNVTAFHLNQLEWQAEHISHQSSESQQFENHNSVTHVTFLRPNIVEHGVPLHSPNQLQSGATLGNTESDLPNTIKKSPSNQELPKLRWGIPSRRTTGRSKTGLQIQVPDRQSSRSIPTDPPPHDKSIVYVYSSSSSGGGRTSHSFGAIGDRRPVTAGLSSAPLACYAREHIPRTGPATADNISHLALHDLVITSTPESEEKAVLTGDESEVPSTAPFDYNATESLAIRHLAPTPPSKYPTLHDLVDGSTPDVDQYELLVVGETGPLKQDVVPHGVAPSPFTDHATIETPPKPSEYQEKETSFSDVQALGSPVLVEDAAAEADPPSPPTWRRNGRSFASSIRRMPSLYQGEYLTVGAPQFVNTETTHTTMVSLDDKLDPEEFYLPFGSLVYSMKSSTVLNLQISINKSVWTSTLGSNVVLTEAWERKKPEEKIILLFSISHNTKHTGKYLGMAEMIGPLDLNADCDGWPEQKNGPRGLIPIHWIVAKDVAFAKFHDLRYHEQPIIQVRHGNTIPGEVGRLVIQRYFEAAHSSTVTLHPRSQIARPVDVAPSPGGRQPRPWNVPLNRHERPGRRFQRGRGNSRAGLGGGFRGGLQARWSQNAPRNAYTATHPDLYSAYGQPSQPMPHPFHIPTWRLQTHIYAPQHIQGGPSSAFMGGYHAPSAGLHGMMPPIGTLYQPRESKFQQQMGPPQHTGRYLNRYFRTGTNRGGR